MNGDHIIKEDVFRFFNYKWEKVPTWAEDTELVYRNWYLKKYNYENNAEFAAFLNKKSKCADMGAGLGRDVKFFRELAPDLKIIAVDQSEEALSNIAANQPTVKTCQIDITDRQQMLEKLGNDFDFISCDQVLHHTPDPVETLRIFADLMLTGATLHFFVCRKKNEYRDFVDDTIMHHARHLSAPQLWKFAETVTQLGKELHELHRGEVTFQGKEYSSLQNFVHNQVFRCWYRADIPFELSVSSNYDWFSNNPRYSVDDVKSWLSELNKLFQLENLFSDDASVAAVVRKL
ncbi:class I SAM-dependent methyltransferase [bacterium]|nr:class I SAM-dependent methyltransferase [bacterium]